MCIHLKPHREESVQRQHPWIFSGAIATIDGKPSEGDVVTVVDSQGNFVGAGHYANGSIAVRLLTFRNESIDNSFWERMLYKAYDLRKRIGLTNAADTTAYRLVHGEGDGLPGLIIDVYGTTAVMQAHSVGMHRARKEIAEVLTSILRPAITSVYYKSDGTLPRAWRSDEFSVGTDGYLVGDECEHVCKENGLLYAVDWQKGQKTGFFVDQRENRLLLRSLSKDCSVLNMFCYTGGFSVSALAGGATRVVSVDTSERAIEQTKQNAVLNFTDTTRHEAVCEDGFKFLEKSNEEFDIVVLDPPAFAKHRGALHNALKGYTRLNKLGIGHVTKGGLLFTFSCSQVVTKEHFRNAVLSAAASLGRSATIMYQLHQPADHPVSLFHPEGEYLKGLVLKID